MKLNMTLGKRIAFGIIVMLILMAMVGTAGYYGLNRVLSVMAFNNTIRMFQNSVSSIKEQTDQYQLIIYSGESDLKEAARKEVFIEMDKGLKLIERIKSLANIGDAGKEKLASAEAEIKGYKDDFNGLILTVEKRGQLNEQIGKTYDRFVKDVEGQFMAEEIDRVISIFISNFSAYNTQASEKNWARLMNNTTLLKKKMDAWHEQVETSEELSAVSNKLKVHYQSMNTDMEIYHNQVADQFKFRSDMDIRKKNLNDIVAILSKISSQQLQTQIIAVQDSLNFREPG